MEENSLLKGILDDARKEAGQVLARAEEQARRRLALLNDQIVSIHEEDERRIESYREAARRRSDALIATEKRRRALKRREELTGLVVSRARKLLEEQIDLPDYSDFLARCIAEGVLGVNREEVLVRCSARENLSEGTMKKAMDLVRNSADRDMAIRVSGESHSDQGIVVSSADGRVSYNNRIAARFRRYDQEIKEIIGKAGQS